MGDGGDVADGPRETDPRRIRSLAVTTEDVVTALEANERRGRGAVLRVTPPFAGRMRARLHLDGAEGAYDGDVRPVHLSPDRLVRDAPPFPTVDETGDELRASDEAYTADRHRERHAKAVDAWRRAVRGRLVGGVTLDTPDGPHEVDVRYLG
ncbi:hypothetical protein [Halogeometricum limi]|uniref:DUF8009 domain-containing protein n=1 Tax=Halogeometricum limi TaxID=555875 RepID=A0A1I6IQY0_9EURY|nr:hypothetical protein [Halogeometricum limi]SFR69165.1 hypothetical protein SAMN04488124_3545 [Halogeometricum limi]